MRKKFLALLIAFAVAVAGTFTFSGCSILDGVFGSSGEQTGTTDPSGGSGGSTDGKDDPSDDKNNPSGGGSTEGGNTDPSGGDNGGDNGGNNNDPAGGDNTDPSGGDNNDPQGGDKNDPSGDENGDKKDEGNDDPTAPPPEGLGEGEVTEINNADLSIHFINYQVYNAGDCTLIKVGDTEVLIDAGAKDSCAGTIKQYIDKYCTDGKLEYVIATHAHEDHIAGFVGNTTNRGILYSYDIGTIIMYSRKKTTSKISSDFQIAVDYAVGNGAKAYTALQCWNETDGAQKKYYLDAEQTISINILYNYYYDHSSSDENNFSVCMLLTQELGNGYEYNYLFTGDLEEGGEKYLVQYNQLPEVELYKAGHHGSKTSSNECLLSVIKPKHVAVCCCAGSNEYTKENDNMFPTQAFIDRISKYTDSVYCLNVIISNEDKHSYEPMNGDIVFYTIQRQLKLWCSNNTTKLKDTAWFAENRHGWGINE